MDLVYDKLMTQDYDISTLPKGPIYNKSALVYWKILVLHYIYVVEIFHEAGL